VVGGAVLIHAADAFAVKGELPGRLDRSPTNNKADNANKLSFLVYLARD
jgi:hypothetical protein